MVLREGARAAVKLLPGWGNAISGGVAAAGTYAIGRVGDRLLYRRNFARRGTPAFPPRKLAEEALANFNPHSWEANAHSRPACQ